MSMGNREKRMRCFGKKARLKCIFRLFILFYVHEYFACMHAWCPTRSEKCTQAPETGVTDGFDLLCGCWELEHGSFARASALNC